MTWNLAWSWALLAGNFADNLGPGSAVATRFARTALRPGHESEMGGPFFVYILASKRNGTLYIGVTNNLARRSAEHKGKLVPGFHAAVRS